MKDILINYKYLWHDIVYLVIIFTTLIVLTLYLRVLKQHQQNKNKPKTLLEKLIQVYYVMFFVYIIPFQIYISHLKPDRILKTEYLEVPAFHYQTIKNHPFHPIISITDKNGKHLEIKINNLDVNFDKKSNHSDIIIKRVTYDLKNQPTETSLTIKNQIKPIDNIEWKQKGN